MKNPHQKDFRAFIRFLKEPAQRNELIIFSGLFILIGVVFHIYYPFPFTYPDSGMYVLSAKEGVFNIYRPMGYSSYLNLAHIFGSGPTVLFIVSSILNALSLLFILFSAKYLFNIKNRILFYLISLAAILSPRIIFCTNFIMSDGIFNTLMIFYIATAMWIVFSRNFWWIVIHVLIFIFLFNVRYSGFVVFPISMIAFFFSYKDKNKKAASAMALIPLLISGMLYVSVKTEYTEQTKVDTFSGFGGWQLINNASVLFPEAKEINSNELTNKNNLRDLHLFLQQYPDSIFKSSHTMETAYMWERDLPYKQFLSYYIYAKNIGYERGWVEAGAIYEKYANMLIRKYPGRYFSRYIIPSFLSNFKCHPISEESTVFKNEPIYRDYFGIQEETFTYNHHFFYNLTPARKIVNYVYWIILGLCVGYFCVTQLRKRIPHKTERTAAGLILAFLVIYLAGLAIASPSTTWRYTMPMYIPSLVFMLFCFSDFIDRHQGDH